MRMGGREAGLGSNPRVKASGCSGSGGNQLRYSGSGLEASAGVSGTDVGMVSQYSVLGVG